MGLSPTPSPIHRVAPVCTDRGNACSSESSAPFIGIPPRAGAPRIQPIVDDINRSTSACSGVSEDELRGQTAKFRAIIRERTARARSARRRAQGRKAHGERPAERDRIDTELTGADGRGGAEEELRDAIAEVLDEILPEAFATVREACRRLVGTTARSPAASSWNMVPYDVQLIGGIQLHLGKIAEMATGEGKTLVATLPLYLNALPGRGAHLVTVNSYLARRDSQWMGHLFSYLGLTVGCLDDTEPGSPERRAAYLPTSPTAPTTSSASTTCATTWSSSLEQRVQREHVYAIVDEVDSVLIDEARTPLIISGPGRQRERRDVLRAQRRGRASSCAARRSGQHARRRGRARSREGRHADAAALKLYKAQLGDPKNKRLLSC